MILKESPSQTAGPYVHIGCTPKTAGLERQSTDIELGEIVASGGETIELDVTIVDGAGDVVRDALIEIWQAGPDGGFTPTETFKNWGRKASNLQTGLARFQTVKPGRVDGQAPHILVWIAARGINVALTTRIYFPDEDNSVDPVNALADSRFATLVAHKTQTGYAHTIYLQGENETVFFDV